MYFVEKNRKGKNEKKGNFIEIPKKKNKESWKKNKN